MMDRMKQLRIHVARWLVIVEIDSNTTGASGSHNPGAFFDADAKGQKMDHHQVQEWPPPTLRIPPQESRQSGRRPTAHN